jgi:hypothetical protein
LRKSLVVPGGRNDVQKAAEVRCGFLATATQKDAETQDPKAEKRGHIM